METTVCHQMPYVERLDIKCNDQVVINIHSKHEASLAHTSLPLCLFTKDYVYHWPARPSLDLLLA